jgi:hypothetical protein
MIALQVLLAYSSKPGFSNREPNGVASFAFEVSHLILDVSRNYEREIFADGSGRPCRRFKLEIAEVDASFRFHYVQRSLSPALL